MISLSGKGERLSGELSLPYTHSKMRRNIHSIERTSCNQVGSFLYIDGCISHEIRTICTFHCYLFANWAFYLFQEKKKLNVETSIGIMWISFLKNVKQEVIRFLDKENCLSSILLDFESLLNI